MARSQRDRIVSAMEGDGWILDVHARTGKYWVYRRPGSPVRVFLGASGAMRHSAKGIVSDCRPVPESCRLGYLNRALENTETSLAEFMAS